MPITTDKNTNYGPPLVTQKYAPLREPVFTGDDRDIYSGLLNNRRQLFDNSGLLPSDLKLALPNWAAAIASEANHNPPLVVISSNRSKWIKQGIDAAAVQLKSMKGQPTTFESASDLNALAASGGQTVSPPIYTPSRLGPNPARNVYIVVHMTEYKSYKRNLADTGITVVGWEFALPLNNRAPRKVMIAGFGASRYAAIAFLKRLRTAAAAVNNNAAPWDYAWLIDDNVVALTDFAGFAAAEEEMTADEVCAGFHGGTVAEAFAKNRDWARNELKEGRGEQADSMPESKPPGIVQQTSLWNIAYLAANHLNFGPAYVCSGEDLSITNYFNHEEIPYFYYKGITVRKEETGYDGGSPGNAINGARERITSWVSTAESADPPGVTTPPPPIMVKPVNEKDDGGEQLLADFIVKKVLPASLMKAQSGKVTEQAKAKCLGVEQITCGAINEGFVSDNAQNATFKINGTAEQVIQQVNLP